MKTFNFIIVLLVAFATQAFGKDLTPSQEKAQRSLYAYLQKEKFEPKVDTSDNSVCFWRGEVFYWINIEGESPFMFSFHRKAFKVGQEEGGYKRDIAIKAAHEVNRKHKMVKLTVEEKKVEIAIRVYVDKTEEFTAVFHKYLDEFKNVDTDFKKAYEMEKAAIKKAEERAEEEARKNLPPSVLRNKIINVSFRLIDTDGNEKTAYDQPLRSFNARYIQPRLEFEPWRDDNATFTIQIKVTRPNGKPIYLEGKKYTAEKEIQIEKSKKNQFIELVEFGSEKEGFWKAGEYKVEVMESKDVIFTTTFNIL